MHSGAKAPQCQVLFGNAKQRQSKATRSKARYGKGLAKQGTAKYCKGEVMYSFATVWHCRAGRSIAKAKVKTGNNIAERKQNDNKRNTTKKDS